MAFFERFRSLVSSFVTNLRKPANTRRRTTRLVIHAHNNTDYRELLYYLQELNVRIYVQSDIGHFATVEDTDKTVRKSLPRPLAKRLLFEKETYIKLETFKP